MGPSVSLQYMYVCLQTLILCVCYSVLVCDCGGGCSTQWTGKYSYSTIVMLHNTCTCSYIMINYQAYGIAPTAHVMANGKGNLIHVHV